jgi:(2Fe-2S) ferredoxin
MKPDTELIYQKHIFICTNDRPPDALRRSCGQAYGLELVDAFKAQLKALPVAIRARAQRAGCLDICDWGPTVAVYPEGVFYVNVQVEDVSEIVQEHILNNRPVERLRLKAKPSKTA